MPVFMNAYYSRNILARNLETRVVSSISEILKYIKNNGARDMIYHNTSHSEPTPERRPKHLDDSTLLIF